MNAVVKENQIVEFYEFEAQLTEFKGRYEGVVYDLSDPKQDKQARSDKYAIARVISALDDRHKELKAPLKIKTDLIDGERKRIKDQLLDVQGKIKSQIDEHEAAIQAKKDALLARVQSIYALAEFGEYEKPTAAQLAERLTKAKAAEIDDTFEDMKAEAALAQVSTVKKLEALHTERVKHEAEQAELDRLRKESEARDRADREERIRKEAESKAQKEAEEKAKREADRVEREKREAAELSERAIKAAEDAMIKAEQESKLAAERAAKAERERIEREQKAAAEKAEAERKADEAKKAKQEHRAKIHKQAKESFVANGFDDALATKAVELIRDGQIKNVTITY
jgi:colicin import membrane protein